ncbi:MAG TPA: tyrosine--tRNA ligase [Acidimicrobiia bacterium]|nr:tyrosine--tRNA ligase [Acidimicrobiia bacterium]
MPPVQSQLEVLLRGVDQVVPRGELATRLDSGRPLRVKLGLDPTAPAVTLGWAVVLRKLRHFQEFGHTAVLIVGDFTARVGDPSGKTETRRRLSEAEVRGYAESLIDQFSKVLLPEPLEIRYNSEWLAPLDMAEVLELTSKVTVAHLLERGDFALRFEGQKAISLMEFMYPLLQGMDSVAVDADIELGGSDQLWNLMMGRVLMERYGKVAQVAMTMPLLVGLDGEQKMSQSLGNYIAVKEPPEEMFGKVMSLPDRLMGQWFRLAADRPEEEVATIEKGLADGSRHPGETKRLLARQVVSLYWGEQAASAGEAAFDRVFRDGETPEEIKEWPLPPGDPIHLPTLLRSAGLVESSSEARRLISQGAVRLGGERVSEETETRARLAGAVLSIGKRRFLRLLDAS